MTVVAALILAAGLAGADCASTELAPRGDISLEAQQRRESYKALAIAAACRNGVDPVVFDALIIAESRYNPVALSPAGAMGLGQLMPGTARMLGVNPWDPAQNLDGSARYFRQMLDEFGSVRLALAAYNSGPKRVRDAGGVPAIAETRSYVATIETGLLRSGAGPFGPPPVRAALMVTNAGAGAGATTPATAVADQAPPPQWDVFARFRWEQDQAATQRANAAAENVEGVN